MVCVVRDNENKENVRIARDKPRRIYHSVMQEEEYTLYYTEYSHAHQRRHWAELEEVNIHQQRGKH